MEALRDWTFRRCCWVRLPEAAPIRQTNARSGPSGIDGETEVLVVYAPMEDRQKREGRLMATIG